MQSRFKDWGDIRIFLTVMREGSTLGAARVLDLNQTTVARRLDALEHALGLTLFVKSTRGAAPTAAALNLLPLAERLADAALALESQAMDHQRQAKSPIRVTMVDAGIAGNIDKIVAGFVEKNPDVSFEFIASERILDLMKGEADVAVRMSPALTDDRLIARKIGKTAWTYYASREYAKVNDLPATIDDDMSAHRVLLLAHIPTKRRNVTRCASGKDLTQGIRSGQGIGPVPILEGDNDPDLVRCFDPPPTAHMTAWLVTSPQAHKRAEVRNFMAYAAPLLADNLTSRRD